VVQHVRRVGERSPGDGRSDGDVLTTPVLHRWRRLRSPQLQNYRDVLIALPASAEQGDRRYPVIYMQDGQNLFDPATSFAGDWSLLDTLTDHAAAGHEAIVVGIEHTRGFRKSEYSPFHDPVHGGGDGDRYLEFLVETLKPLVDRAFPTLEGPAHTAIAGASLGGLVSLFALLQRPDVFGAAGALSPSAWVADEALLEMVGAASPRGRVWLDLGTGEDERLVRSVRRLHDRLVARGWREGHDLRYREDEGAEHHESAWGARFRDALPFLIGRHEKGDAA
jgi:predicted alpha/beta superfamily hydrolase